MTFTNFIPPKTYNFLVKIADENRLSVKEVERIFLNYVCHLLGMTCNHERIGKARNDPEHKPYCKDCWERLRAMLQEPYRIGTKLIKGEIRYVEKETFLDDFLKEKEAEQAKKYNADFEARVNAEVESRIKDLLESGRYRIVN